MIKIDKTVYDKPEPSDRKRVLVTKIWESIALKLLQYRTIQIVQHLPHSICAGAHM